MAFLKHRIGRWGFVVLVAALALLAWVAVFAAPAATITVDSTADSGPGTLREAITTAGSGDTIVFDTGVFSPTSPVTIALASGLPALDDGNVTIDGSDAGVILDGSGTPTDTVGISITSNGNAVKGLQILDFPDGGVMISAGAKNNTIGGDTPEERNVISGNGGVGVAIKGSGTEANTISGNYIGTDASGMTGMGNLFGVYVYDGAKSNIIGGTTAGERNVISGNDFHGVAIYAVPNPGTDANTVTGNCIGTDAAGTTIIGNGLNGVKVAHGAKNNVIGGDTVDKRNLISGNNGNGVLIDDEGTENNTVSGNYIGTDVNGTAALPNAGHGVEIINGAKNNTIGGSTDGERNVISGNQSYGIRICDEGVDGNVVSGNYIGVDATGMAALGNDGDGVIVACGAKDNRVGGTTVGERNVVSANGCIGVGLGDPGTTGNVISGNTIGLDAAGTAALGNGCEGVIISDGPQNNIVGGDTPGERNLISGNNSQGVRIAGSDTTSNTVTGNTIGTDVNGTEALPNGEHGVVIDDGAHDNVVGGSNPGEGNLISGNTNDGVRISGSGAEGNVVIGNHIGLDSSGSAALGNGEHGVEIVNGAARNTVGGTTEGERNVISGNARHGITIGDPGGDENVVSGNTIGTGAAGTAALGNGEAGVAIRFGGQGNLVGGASVEAGNLIAHNTEAGVLVEGSGSTGNTISHNAITSNGGLGIENADGGNTELAPPTITGATCSSVSGTAPSNATVEIFSDPADEGRTYEGAAIADGTGVFTWIGSVTGPHVTATATDGAGNTSQFSAPLALVCHRVYLPLAVKNYSAPMEVFKLGILGPFSGPSSVTGDEFEGAVNMAFDAIDWHIGEVKIEPVWIDSESDPDQAVRNYEEAIVQEGVEAGLLNWHSSVAVSCMEVVADHQVPHFAGFGATEVVNETFNSDRERYGYWTTKMWPTPSKLNVSYVEMLEHAIDSGAWSPAAKTVVISGEDTGWGRGFGDAIKGNFEDAGWTIVAEAYFTPGQTDFSTVIPAIKALDPAVVAGSTYSPESAYALINQADAADLESVMIVDGLGYLGDWYSATGDASNYVLDQQVTWATDEGEAFRQAYEARYGTDPSPSSGGLAYDAANFFVQVAEEVYQESGELSSEAIYQFVQDEIWTGQWSYTDGIMMEEYKYTEETIPDPVIGEGYYMFPVLQYFDGEGMIVFPPAWADQPFTPPPGG